MRSADMLLLIQTFTGLITGQHSSDKSLNNLNFVRVRLSQGFPIHLIMLTLHTEQKYFPVSVSF